MLLAYIHRSITHRVHFLDNARSHLWGSFICAKNLLIEATWRPSHMGPMPTSSTFKAVARRLTAMPEVLPVQFMQMLCSNGVKLSLDLTVADECDGQHKQCCANDPQSEEPTSQFIVQMTLSPFMPTSINSLGRLKIMNRATPLLERP